MKRYKYTIVLLLVVVLPYGQTTSASGKDGPITPAKKLKFDVTYEDRIYRVDEPIDFTIEGNAEEIYFYSGEVGSRYEFRNEGEKIAIDNVKVTFESARSNLKVPCHRWIMISNDFNGEYKSEAAIKAATWTDITHRFTLASDNQRTKSGTIDLTRYTKQGPFYFAFRYISEEYTIAARPPSWRIYDFRIWGTTGKGRNKEEFTLGDISKTPQSANFIAYDFQAEDGLGYNRVGPNYLRMEPFKEAAPSELHEVWIISKAIDGNLVTESSEIGTVLRCACQQPIKEHRYAFNAAGQYSVVFVGIDSDSGERIVKTLDVTVK